MFRAILLLTTVVYGLTVGSRAVAQDNPAPLIDTMPAEVPANTEPRLSANNDFKLNITKKRIVQQDYKASTSIEGGDAGASGISLRVGAVVRASEINMLLQNIHGQVHFTGSLERLRQSLRSPDVGNRTPK